VAEPSETCFFGDGRKVFRRRICAACYADPEKRKRAPRQRARTRMVMAPWRVPMELPELVRAAAAREGIEPAEWVRRTLRAAAMAPGPDGI
jgi:hypothetical protein